MTTRYAIQNSQQSEFVLASNSRDIVYMGWPAYQTDSRFSLVKLEGDRIRVIEQGGGDKHKKLAEEYAR